MADLVDDKGMFRLFFIYSFLLITFAALGQEVLGRKIYYTRDLKSQITFRESMGVRFFGANGSMAENVIKEVSQIDGKINFSFDGRNPVVILCQLYDGKHDFAFLDNGDQVPVCGYKDKSFFISWDLFESKV